MTDQPTLDFLTGRANKIGVKLVRDTCKTFLMPRSHGVTREKRTRISKSTRNRLYAAQNGLCARCELPMTIPEATVDHIVALSLGGKNHYRNLCLMHKSCNSSKGSRDPLSESKASGRTVAEQFKHSIAEEPDAPESSH